MDIKAYKQKVKETVVQSMVDYMSEDEDCGYSKKDVKKCEDILVKYLDKLGKLKTVTDEAILAAVKDVVFALNKLNEQTDYCLIETDAREDIWQIIQDGAVECGLTESDYDVTEEWREW